MVLGSIEKTPSELLEAETEKVTRTAYYECGGARQGYRRGATMMTRTSHYLWRRHTARTAASRSTSFETASIERYRCRESSVEDALIKMYLVGGSIRCVERTLAKHCGGSQVSPDTISEPNKSACVRIEIGATARCGVALCVCGWHYLRRNWGGFFEWLRGPGLDGVKLIVGDRGSWRPWEQYSQMSNTSAVPSYFCRNYCGSHSVRVSKRICA